MTKKQKYPTDLTDEQVEFIKKLLPASSQQGRPPLEMSEVLNAILYVLVGGIPWRMLPHDFPAWKSVYHYFWKWRTERGKWRTARYECKNESDKDERKRRARAVWIRNR